MPAECPSDVRLTATDLATGNGFYRDRVGLRVLIDARNA